MFGKKIEKDPQKALDNAKKTLNSGLTGGLTKAFMGKDFVNDMNSAMDKGQAALDMQKSGAWLAQGGMPATAVVESIEDTGSMINNDPVLKLKLKVTPQMGAAFETTGTSMVSKIAIPRKGETVNIKYNPADPTQFVVVP
jgi:predicted dienelactone hydrolase